LSEGHHKRGLPLERIVALAATNPARIMGLGHAKGSLTPGLDADLVLADLDAEWTLERGDVVSSAGYSIYEGQRFRGRIRDAFVRGRQVLREDTLLNDAVGAGLGKLPDSYCNSMECFRRVGSHNLLIFLICHTPSTGT